MKKINISIKKLFKKFYNIFSFIKIDFSFVFIFVIAYFLNELKLYFYFVIFLLLHEFSHYFIAKRLGYLAKNIRLSIFGASLEGLDDFLCNDELKIVLAGPIFNFFVIIFCYLSFWFYPKSYNFLYDILIANYSILIFNILPIYPLDAGRILLIYFSKNNLRIIAIKKVKIISFIFILILFTIFFISIFFSYNFMLGIVCVNLMWLLFSSTKNTSYKRELFIFHKAKLLKRGLIEKNIYILDSINDYELFKFIDDYHFFNFIFLDKNYEITSMMSEIEFYKKIGYL